jgi:DNA-binding GntR family transcriptional regulator
MGGRTSESLRRELEDDIEHGRLSPGDRHDEQTLAARFEVSRTPAREALLQLAAAGIVRMVPRQGAVVTGVSAQRGVGMVEVLTALEAEAAGLAARRMSEAEKAKLAELHAASEPVAQQFDSKAYLAHNDAFHAVIYDGARNEYLAEQIRLTRRGMRFYHRSSLSQPARVRASWREHGRVLEAIRSGDEAQAQAAMREHILYGGRVFADMIATLTNNEGKS